MDILEKKIDFVAIISVKMANPNGDPLSGNCPRTDSNSFGEISDVCIKRKIRNRMQDLGKNIFVQSNDRCADGFNSLQERADNIIKDDKGDKIESTNNKKAYFEFVCNQWLDVRSFGQVFAFKNSDDSDGVSVGVRGPVSIHQAVSVNPIDICSMQITKSVNGKTDKKKARDTMGMKHFVRFGLYVMKGSINVQLAQKTGFSSDDADVVKECLRTLFVNDTSSARPDGSMEVVKLFWFKHNCKDGQYSSAKVHRAVKVMLKPNIDIPTSVDDYEIKLNEDEIKNIKVLGVDEICADDKESLIVEEISGL